MANECQPSKLVCPTKRILNMKEAASYLGMSVTTFREHVVPKVAGIKLMPHRISYDIEALNRFIDKASGKKPDPREDSFWDKYR